MAQTPQPAKIQKQKKTDKKVKKKALQEFLKTQTSAVSDVISTNISEIEQKVDAAETNNCYLCMVQLPAEKKKCCGFCNMPACSEHMRKKRKNKQINKFVRICDDCDDRYLYSNYMKLELKNQQSLSIQESIIQSKRDQIQQKLKITKQKYAVHEKKKNEILSTKKQKQDKIIEQETELEKNKEKLKKRQQQLQEDKKKLKQFEQKLPPSLEQDYQSLQLQLQKVKKEMLRYDKLLEEARKSKAKRQKQIYDEYYKWQEAQKRKLQTKKEQECTIF